MKLAHGFFIKLHFLLVFGIIKYCTSDKRDQSILIFFTLSCPVLDHGDNYKMSGRVSRGIKK